MAVVQRICEKCRNVMAVSGAFLCEDCLLNLKVIMPEPVQNTDLQRLPRCPNCNDLLTGRSITEFCGPGCELSYTERRQTLMQNIVYKQLSTLPMDDDAIPPP